MIDKAMSFIEERINEYFQGLLGPSTEDYAVLGNIAKIVDAGEGSEDEGSTGVIITLVNIEEDRISKNPEGFFRENGKIIRRNPEVLVNLYVLFSINLNSYTTALSRISNVIQFFQSEQHFEIDMHSTLDPRIVKLHLELYTMNFEQVNHLWSTLGGKYLPSVLYKMKLIPIVDEANQREGMLITEINGEKKVLTPH